MRPHPLLGQSRTTPGTICAALVRHPAPSPTFGDRGESVLSDSCTLDCGLRRNDGFPARWLRIGFGPVARTKPGTAARVAADHRDAS